MLEEERQLVDLAKKSNGRDEELERERHEIMSQVGLPGQEFSENKRDSSKWICS